MELIGESLRWAEPDEPDEQLADKVLAQVVAISPPPRRQWSVWTHATLAAAVALLVAAILPRGRQEMTTPVVAFPPEQQQLARIEPAVTLPPAPAVGQLAREATAHYATLARNTSQTFAGVWSLWRPTVERANVLHNMQAAQSGPDQPLLAEMAAGLRPLADSTSGAVRFLLDVLPRGESSSEAVPVADPIEPSAGQTAT
jgi:hypothetical protein